MPYYIGVDGGGTKTKAILGDQYGNICGYALSGSSNLLAVGKEDAFNHINESITLLCSQNKICSDEIKSIVLGIAGAGREPEKEQIKTFIQSIHPKTHVDIYDDAYIALFGAHGVRSGGLIIAGTGAIARAFAKNENLIRVGGYGHILDDFGSGYDIGRKALTAALFALDGRSEHTQIVDLLTGQNMGSQDQIIQKVYQPDFKKQDIAVYSKIAFQAASAGDKIAKNIIEEASESIALLGKTLISHCNDDKLSICLSGGLLEGIPEYRKSVSEKIKKYYPKAQLIQAKHDAATGALMLAWQSDLIKIVS